MCQAAGGNCYTVGIMLKPKSIATLDAIIANPKISNTQAYLDNHGTTSRRSGEVGANKLMRKVEAQIYLKKHVQMAKKNIVDIAGDKNIKADTRLKANFDILDRNLGKAIQKTVSENTNLNINVEASKELADKFTEFMRSNTAT